MMLIFILRIRQNLCLTCNFWCPNVFVVHKGNNHVDEECLQPPVWGVNQWGLPATPCSSTIGIETSTCPGNQPWGQLIKAGGDAQTVFLCFIFGLKFVCFMGFFCWYFLLFILYSEVSAEQGGLSSIKVEKTNFFAFWVDGIQSWPLPPPPWRVSGFFQSD